MIFYSVPLIGTGISDDLRRPDLPEGTPGAGTACAPDSYLIATADPIEGLTPLTEDELMMMCEEHGLIRSDLDTWSVSSVEPAPISEPAPVHLPPE